MYTFSSKLKVIILMALGLLGIGYGFNCGYSRS
jgi:hypothetical protein